MRKLLIAGAGKIGTLIACLFSQQPDYKVWLADVNFSGPDIKRLQKVAPLIHTLTFDVANHVAFSEILKTQSFDAIISSLPYFCNVTVAKVAKEFGLNYFDLTEDTQVVKAIHALAKDAKTAFVPQCGLAPGFANIVANDLMQHFEDLNSAEIRVGALPTTTNNCLHYALTWSTEGLINQYGNPCRAIEEGEPVWLQPLEGLESIELDGSSYEAFNTSGGLGSMVDLYAGKIKTLNYKTLRYPGHCQKIRFLMNDLDLNHDRVTLKNLLEHAVPKTYQDVAVIYIVVQGIKNGILLEESFFHKVYPINIANLNWSAIQISTAAGVCAVVDLVLSSEKKYQGFVYQEQFPLKEILTNRFGQYYQ